MRYPVRKARKPFVISAGKFDLLCGAKTQVMGIINCTPDSFSRDGLLRGGNDGLIQKALCLSRKMVKDGADILDVGGESTRPGAPPVSLKDEIDRVIPVITRLVKQLNVPVSVDTYKPEVAQRALDAGAAIVNDVMGSKPDKRLLKMARDYDAAIVLMHIRGTPRTMQKNIRYKDVVTDVAEILKRSVEICLETGIDRKRIIIDPGIGFGKTVEHNLELIARLGEFGALKCPLLLGASRKSFIGKVLLKDTDDRLYGTLASICAGVMNGAHIVRVHDVGPVKDAVTLIDSIMGQGTDNK